MVSLEWRDLFMFILSRFVRLAAGFSSRASCQEQRVKLSPVVGETRIGRQVVVFVQVVFQVVQFRLLLAAPLAVVPSLRADRSTERFASADNGVGDGATFGIRGFKQRDDAQALKCVWTVDLAQFDERGEQVDQFHQSFAAFAVFRQAGHANDQRHTRAFFEQRHLAPQRVLAQMISVVRCENDDRVVPATVALERIKEQRDLCINEPDASVVSLRVLPA